MSAERYQRYCQDLADLFLAGDPMDMAKHYTYPLALYLQDAVQVEQSPGDTVTAILRRRARVLARGTTRIVVKLLAVEPCEDGRLQLRCSWSYLDKSGRPIDASVLVYFCTRRPDGSLRIRMVQFETQAFSTGFDSSSAHGAH